MNIEIKDLICPITKQIFRNPITLEDEITYEYAIVETSIKIIKSKNYNYKIYKNINLILRNIIDELEKNNLIDSNLRYPDYVIKKFDFNLEYFKNLNTIQKQKDYLDDVDLETYIDTNNYKPIHYISQYSTPEVIKYIIDKGVDLEAQTKHGCKPIHFICRCQSPEAIKYIIDKGVDLECETNDGRMPIDFVSNQEIIDYMRKKINEKNIHGTIKINERINFFQKIVGFFYQNKLTK